MESQKKGSLVYKCPKALHDGLLKVTRGKDDIKDIIWISVLSIITRLFFRMNEIHFEVRNPDGDRKYATIDTIKVEEKNFFTLVKDVKESLSEKCNVVHMDILIGRLEMEREEERYLLQFEWNEIDDSTIIEVRYSEQMISKEYLDNMINLTLKAILFFIKTPGEKIESVKAIFQEDYELICNVFNDTSVEYPENQDVYSSFKETALRSNYSIALKYGSREYTYRKLYEMVCNQMFKLTNNGVKAYDVVGIFIEDKVEQIVNILAILGCGCAYLPIDITYPEQRIQHMLQDAKVKHVVVSDQFKEMNIFTSNNVIGTKSDSVDTLFQIPEHQISGDSIAYIMYTSGSTGKAKGVAIRHKSILRLVKNNGFLQILDKDRILQTSSIVFDASIIEIYGALLNGACLVLTDKQDIIQPDKMKKLIYDNEISILWVSSPLFTQLSNQDPFIFRGVRHLLVGGDVLSPKHINIVRQNCEGIEIINGYGPTENTTFSTTFSIQDNFESSIPIGKPINNSTVYILNDRNELLPIGAVGEIWVGGDGVAFGYVNDEQLNEKSFIKNPFGKERLYRTGDLGYWRKDGNIEFIGRVDQQSKINGFRIEMGEIEVVALENNKVDIAFAIVEEMGDGKKIILVYTGEESVNDLKKRLKNSLPMYMFPNVVLKVNDIPLNVNGKIDRTALRELINKREDDRNTMERLSEIGQVVSEVVNSMSDTGFITSDKNLFEMSFDSLKIAVMIMRLNKTLGIDLNFGDVFSNPTVYGIAECIIQKGHVQRVISRIPVADKYIASAVQKRIYYSCTIDKDDTSYNVQTLFKFKHKIKKDRIEKIWRTLIRRHEALRTNFVMDDVEIYQIIHNDTDFEVEELSVGNDSIQMIIKSLICKFDLETDWLIYVKLINLENSHYMFVDLHHIIVDGFSVDLLFDEFCSLFRNEELQELEFQNKDIIFSKDNIFSIEEIKRQKQFWFSMLKGYEISDDIITDFNRNEQKRRIGIGKSYEIGDTNVLEMIKKCSVDRSITVFSILLSCLYMTIWKYSNKDSVIAGVPFSGRTLNAMNNVIGMFVNVMPLMVQIQSDQSINEFLEYVKDIVIEAYQNQEYQFDTLVNDLNLSRNKNRNPLFNFTFNVYNQQDNLVIDDNGENELNIVEINFDNVKFDFSMIVLIGKDDLILKVQYDQALYKESTINNFVRSYEQIIKAAISDTAKPLNSIVLATDKDQEMILEQFNHNMIDYEEYNNVYEVFQCAVKQWPYKEAIVFHGDTLTYKDLLNRVEDLAKRLLKYGVSENDRVIILVENKIEQIISILAILRAGGIYVPVDSEYSKSRIKYIVDDSEAKVILIDCEYEKVNNIGIKKINIYEVEKNTDDIQLGELNTMPDDLLYIMYTSGTTGNPKGVMIKQRGVLRLIVNTKYIQLEHNDKILQTSSIVFDASTFEIWNAFIHGMTFYLTEKSDLFDFERLHKLITEYGITVIWLTAPLFQKIGDQLPQCFENIKWLLAGGDVLPVEIVNKVRNECPKLRIINGYGPTENTTFSTFYEITEDCHKSVPIGKPISNSEAYILDKWEHLLPVGAVGEIHVGGPGLAQGYLNDEKQTKQKFRIFNINGREKLLYATGDLGYWREDGNIIFLGRKDNQVKIRGFRIEMDEIRSVAMWQKDVKDAFVTIEREEESLVLYYVSEKLQENELRMALKHELPDFMIPKYIVKVDEIPLNINGKTDMHRLKQIFKFEKTQEKNVKSDIIFASDYEEDIYKIWTEALGFKIESIDINFFDAGGNSMYLLQIYEKIKHVYGQVISISDLFAYTTIRELAGAIERVYKGRHKLAELSLKETLYETKKNIEQEMAVYVLTIESEGYHVLLNEKETVQILKYSIFVHLWEYVLREHVIGNVGVNIYDNQDDKLIILETLSENTMSTIPELMNAHKELCKKLENYNNRYSLTDIDFKCSNYGTQKIKMLFDFGESPEEYHRHFDILIRVSLKDKDIEIMVTFDRDKLRDSQMNELMQNYNNIIRFVSNNLGGV